MGTKPLPSTYSTDQLLLKIKLVLQYTHPGAHSTSSVEYVLGAQFYLFANAHIKLAEFKQKLEKAVDHLRSEIAGLRIGRATPALVEDLEVEYYGVKTLLKAVSAISIPEPRTIMIQPWDKNAMPAIEKAIQNSSLGLNPIADREGIRLTIPSLTEERRKELLKVLGKYLEETRIKVRVMREEILKDIDRKEKAKEISENEKFRQKAEIQKIVDEVNKKIEEMGKGKTREINPG